MVNGLLGHEPVSVPSVADPVYVASTSIFRPPKLTPPPSTSLFPSLDPPSNVPLLNVSVTVDVSVVTILPNVSSMFTVTAGLSATPAVAFVGCCPNTTLLHDPG